ncbi:putative benzoate 4-monooxygenase cytochrome P450 [Xylaria cubensis]|nr:putative benzoate 4-monooxygenase cytochrome P450 [Xylaria cubensis]
MADLACLAVAVGISTHISILSHIDLEMYLIQFISTLGVSLLGSYWALRSLPASLTMFTCYNIGILLSMTVYRLWAHRLGSFPGPFLAKLTRFYGLYLASKDTMYHRELSLMHRQYGDFIRIGPRELCVIRKSAVDALHGPDSKCQKSTWYSQVHTDPNKCSVHTIRDLNQHRLRRKAWDQGLSIKTLATYEGRVKRLIELFLSKISLKKVVEITEMSSLLVFDSMGEIGFGKTFGCLSRGASHPALKCIREHMETIGTLSQVPWLLYLISRIPGVTAGYSEFFRICETEIDAKLKNWDPSKKPNDIASWLLKAFVAKDKSAAPTKQALYEDSRVLIVTGTDTTAGTLSAALYFLAKYPALQRKLQCQCDAVMPSAEDWSYDKVKSITFIDNLINETLRLKPALLVGGRRVTPPGGIQIDEEYIPGDINIITPIWPLHVDPRYWPAAGEFIPERFGERRQEMKTDDAPFFPFGLGAYSCPGKNLFFMSLRIALSRIAQEFDVAFAPGEDGSAFDNGAKETFSTTYPPLVLQFIKRSGRAGSVDGESSRLA